MLRTTLTGPGFGVGPSSGPAQMCIPFMQNLGKGVERMSLPSSTDLDVRWWVQKVVVMPVVNAKLFARLPGAGFDRYRSISPVLREKRLVSLTSSALRTSKWY
jgi:hypothetical protein